MFNTERPVWTEVDLSKLQHNIENIRKRVGDRRIICVVKANAYGHGMKFTQEKMKRMGITDFAVAILYEALDLRGNDKDSSILILGFTPGEAAKEVIENDITASVFTFEEAEKFSREAVKLGKNVKLAAVLDTGMSRIGINTRDPEKAADTVEKISKLPNVIIEEMFSHFSTADEKDKTYSNLQLGRFLKVAEILKDRGVKINHMHHANSAGIIDIPESHLDTVRPGIIQYGYYPSEDVEKENLDIVPILSWKAKIVMVKEIDEGTPVSYGNTFVADKKTVIGTIPLGYADGYSRALSNKGYVLVKGKKAPVTGRICMDQFMVDLTGIEGVRAGDTAVLIGKDGDLEITADDLGKMLGTISYEITCDISQRVTRKYVEDGKFVGSDRVTD